MRGFRTDVTPIVEGHRLYYNFIKPHMALDSKTPAEMMEIKPNPSKNKWLSLIKKSVITQKTPFHVLQDMFLKK